MFIHHAFFAHRHIARTAIEFDQFIFVAHTMVGAGSVGRFIIVAYYRIG